MCIQNNVGFKIHISILLLFHLMNQTLLLLSLYVSTCLSTRLKKVLKIKQNQRGGPQEMMITAKDEITDDGLPKSVSGYNINNNISYSGSNYSFTSGDIFSRNKLQLKLLFTRSLCCILGEHQFS